MKKDGIQTRKRKPKNLAKNKNSSKQEPNGNYLSFPSWNVALLADK